MRQNEPFANDDRIRLEQSGVSLAEAARQLAILESPATYVCLDRPAVTGDGIVGILPDSVPELHRLHAESARQGRWTKFTPASGAATRMFRELHACLDTGDTLDALQRCSDEGDAAAREVVRFASGLDRFAFRDDLARAVKEQGHDLAGLLSAGELQPILEGLLSPSGLDYARLPKGLIQFHRYPGENRTAFEEHLAEAVDCVRDDQGTARLHFTVSGSHRAGFESCLDHVRDAYTERSETRLAVSFSAQKPSTDTLAVDASGAIVRDERGRILLRPGGHGALIENLNDLGADLVMVKNIDNVQPDSARADTVNWKRTLAGLLVRLERSIQDLLARLTEPHAGPDVVAAAREFLASELGLEADPQASLVDRLARPLRVCGVVRNTGEPGGGPFWVRGANGTCSLQIVEAAQVDPDDSVQQSILGQATHFNPVDLYCSVRTLAGTPYDLRAYVDPDTAIIARKSSAGRELLALERPGLWNGAMAAWNTVFVEVPLSTFTPVKTVLDLLRPEHQPG